MANKTRVSRGPAVPVVYVEGGVSAISVTRPSLSRESHKHNPGTWRVVRDKPSQNWVRISAFTVLHLGLGRPFHRENPGIYSVCKHWSRTTTSL